MFLEAYATWLAASDRLSQVETKVFLLWLQGMETHPLEDELNRQIGDEMRRSWDQLLASEAAEGAARARIALLDSGSDEVPLTFRVADTRLNVIVKDEMERGIIPRVRSELQKRFFDLEKRQAELRTAVATGIHKRFGSRFYT